ncbi:hypothetical protein Bbelb_270240 [Branchiostoma belcheri]|nr:hypothetical protein Bbelb_270240 [Branchiostoma belcheri]
MEPVKNSMRLYLAVTLRVVADQHAPVKKRTVRTNLANWVDDELRDVMRLRDEARREALASGLASDLCIYKKLRNKAVQLNRKKKAAYFRSKISESRNNPKDLWRTLNEMMGRGPQRSACAVEQDGVILTKAEDIADYFNTFFTQKVDSLRAGIGSQVNGDPLQLIRDTIMMGNDCSFEFKLAHCDQICKYLESLPDGTATGLDNIDNKLLRLVAKEIARPLCYIINLSLTTSTYPAEWKKAKVVPLPKSTTTRLCGQNSRPISLLSVFSKIMEKVVSTQISTYFKENNLMSPYQHAFRKHHSTCTALLQLVDDWYRKIDQGNIIGVIFLDFSAAFDLVDYNCLLQKLACYGFSDMAVDWMDSYLTGRSQCVHFNGSNSSLKEIHCGVPQGSCLGPLLFTIYTNDLPLAVTEATPAMYADDTSAYTCATTIQTVTSILQREMCRLHDWVKLNKLCLNPNKTKCMVLGSRPKISKKPVLTLYADGSLIQQVTEMKLLGGVLDDMLTWDLHIKHIIKKMACSLGVIRKNVSYLDRSLLKLLTESLTLTHLDYCTSVWSSTSQRNITALQTLQNKAGRLILKCDRRTRVNQIHEELSWQTVEERLNINNICTFKKILSSKQPAILYNQLCPVSHQHTYRTRYATRNTFKLDKPKTNSTKKAFTYRTTAAWNSLPHGLQTVASHEKFKQDLLKHMRDMNK